MKIIKLLLISLIIFSCSKDDDPEFKRDNLLNPPNWIHGTWKNPNTEWDPAYTFIFSKDNVILKFNNSEPIYTDNFLSIIKEQSLLVSEKISNSEYSFALENPVNGDIGEYLFEKSTNNEILYLIPNTQYIGGFQIIYFEKQ